MQKCKINLIYGIHNKSDGLWDVAIPNTMTINKINSEPTLQANAIVEKYLPKSQLADYLHACAFSPFLPTFKKAINKGQFITWPSIDKLNFQNLLSMDGQVMNCPLLIAFLKVGKAGLNAQACKVSAN